MKVKQIIATLRNFGKLRELKRKIRRAAEAKAIPLRGLHTFSSEPDDTGVFHHFRTILYDGAPIEIKDYELSRAERRATLTVYFQKGKLVSIQDSCEIPINPADADSETRRAKIRGDLDMILEEQKRRANPSYLGWPAY